MPHRSSPAIRLLRPLAPIAPIALFAALSSEPAPAQQPTQNTAPSAPSAPSSAGQAGSSASLDALRYEMSRRRDDLADTIKVFREAHGDFYAGSNVRAPVRVTYNYVPDASIKGEQGEFSLMEWDFKATVPLPLSRDTFLVVGALAGQRRYQFDGVPGLFDDTLHRYDLRIGYGAFLSDDLMVQAFWQPGIYSDLDGTLHSEDWRLWYARGAAVWRTAENFFVKVGVVVTDAIDTTAVPVAGFSWQIDERWRIDALLPKDASLSYLASDSLRLFVGFDVEADEYHIRNPEAFGKTRRSVNVQEIYAFVGGEQMFGDHISCFARIGSTVAGHYEYGYGPGTPLYTGTLEPGWFVNFGFGYRF